MKFLHCVRTIRLPISKIHTSKLFFPQTCSFIMNKRPTCLLQKNFSNRNYSTQFFYDEDDEGYDDSDPLAEREELELLDYDFDLDDEERETLPPPAPTVDELEYHFARGTEPDPKEVYKLIKKYLQKNDFLRAVMCWDLGRQLEYDLDPMPFVDYLRRNRRDDEAEQLLAEYERRKRLNIKD